MARALISGMTRIFNRVRPKMFSFEKVGNVQLDLVDYVFCCVFFVV